ncbi:hypothetical protein GGH96_002776 [Coemansia sp. RSA 1972]|nr:hypothetical protein GGH96_002776 [Coemansia sp. RSA 1972]
MIEFIDPSFATDKPGEEEHDHSDDEAVADLGVSDQESLSSADNPVAPDDDYNIRVCTNIKLIEKLGLERMVKQLVFRKKKLHGVLSCQLGPMQYFISLMQALFYDLPYTNLSKPFTTWYELECTGTEPSKSVVDQRQNACEAAARILLNKYPNVSSISALTLILHEYFQKLIVALAVGYKQQLAEFACAMPATIPYTLSAPNLRDLYLDICNTPDPNLPNICPTSLEKINLVLDHELFSWDMFCADIKAEAIVFDNLVDLSITDMVQNGIADDEIIANDSGLVFPKLKRLYLKNIFLSANNAQAIMGRNLKRFTYVGSIVAASQLYSQPYVKLNELYMIWLGDLYYEEVEDFILLANEIFNKTNSIACV